MKKAISTVSLFLLFTAAVAFAASPHFVHSATLTSSGGTVAVCWKEAGLGANQLVTYTLTADGSATYVCENGGGQCPNAANKVTVNGPVTAQASFLSGKNGSISACLSLEPVGPGSFTCPSGQSLTLATASFSNVVVTDTTNGISQTATPQSASFTFFTCP